MAVGAPAPTACREREVSAVAGLWRSKAGHCFSRKAYVALITAVALCVAVEPACAQSPPPCEDRESPHDRRHDGFFARAEVGIALFAADVREPLYALGRTRTQGYGESSGLWAGGTPKRGLVIGGGIWTARIDPTFTVDGRRVSPDDDSVKVTLARFGPIIDWYPDPRAGFHAQVTPAIALLVESDEKGKPIEPGAIGPALAFGLGYEWFISRDFSLGLLARFGVARVDRSRAGRHERTLWETPELMLAYTYH